VEVVVAAAVVAVAVDRFPAIPTLIDYRLFAGGYSPWP